MLVESGSPILRSLKTLARRGHRAGIRSLVTDIAAYVEAGNPLWQAFERHPHYFDPVFVNLVKASEASGTLVPVLQRIVEFRGRSEILRKRVRGAMFYPIILLLACVAVVIVIAKVVVPAFNDLFTKLDVTLPAYTKGFIAVTDFTGRWWWVAVVVLAVLIVIYKLMVRSPLIRLRADRWKLRTPIIGGILRDQAVVEFTRSLSLLLRSGLSMMVTLDLVRNAIHNRAVAHTMQNVRDSVERGEGIEEPLRDAAPIIPPVVTDMLVTGEESGQLDRIGEQIADTYEEEVNIRVATLGDALVPILTVLIGIAVILLALALFMPLVSAIDQLSASSGV
jgi:type IV pilus assembly protein PilC